MARGAVTRLGILTLVTASAVSGDAAAQVPPPGRALAVAGSGFVPGGQELFTLDLAGTPAGGFAGVQERNTGVRSGATLRVLSGALEVVTKDGQPMLRAAEPSELLIMLAQRLPESFTIEVDLVPKMCCPPPDLTLEGTPEINQGRASAHLLWQADGYVAVIGGAEDNQEFPMPEELRVALPAALTEVGVSVEGRTIRLYTNGQRLYEVEASFARGRFLRVSLGGGGGGDDGVLHPVYLARLRIATGAPAAPVVAQQQSGLTGTGTESPPPPLTGVVARVGPQGDASVSWPALQGATSYFVVRWKVDDSDCCSNFSPPEGMKRLEWADGVLPMAGTYGYRVYATTPSGISTGETRVTYPATVAVDPSSILAGRSRGVTESPTTAANPATDARAALLAPPAPRTIALSEVTAIGGSAAVAPRTIEIAGFTAMGGFGAIPPRTIALAEVVARGVVGAIAPRTIDIPVVTGVGPLRTSSKTTGGSAAPASRTIALAGLMGSGAFSSAASRTIALTVITGSGAVGGAATRTIALPGLTATGGFGLIPPRTINLPAVTATGSVTTP